MRNLVDNLIDKENSIIEEITKGVLNLYGYPNNLEFFTQPWKGGTRKGFCRHTSKAFINEEDVVCYVYKYIKDNVYTIEEIWNAEYKHR